MRIQGFPWLAGQRERLLVARRSVGAPAAETMPFGQVVEIARHQPVVAERGRDAADLFVARRDRSRVFVRLLAEGQ